MSAPEAPSRAAASSDGADNVTLAAWLALARADGRCGFFVLDRASGHALGDAATWLLLGLGAAAPQMPLEQWVAAVAATAAVPGAAQADAIARWVATEAAAGVALRLEGGALDGHALRLTATPAGDAGPAEQSSQPARLACRVERLATPAPESAENQLALAVALGDIALWRHDLTTNRIHYNEQAFRVLDIPVRPEGLTLDEVRTFIHPDDMARVMASAETALRTDRPTDMEARYRRADGSWRDVMTRRVVQRDAQGQPIAFVGVALDITDRIAARRRAEEATRRLELVTSTAGIGHWTIEPGARHASWNPALRRLHGLPDDAPPPNWDEWIAHWVHPDDRPMVRRSLLAWLGGGAESADLELRIVRSDGQVRRLRSHSRVEGRGPVPLRFGVLIDISERHDAERALESARERAALAARGAGIATWEQDLADGSAWWDEAMWRLRGLTPRPQPLSEAERIACVHPDDRARSLELLAHARDTHAALDYEFRVVWPDGQVRWLASRSVALRDEGTGAMRRIGVNWDVTERHNADGVRREREVALRESEAKSRFLARMSHELRTPLNAVLGFAQLLSNDERGDDEAAAQRQRRVAHIRSAGEHLLSLINDVLDLARVEGGEMRVARQPVALSALLAETLPLVQAQAQARQIGLHGDGAGLAVLADATRLRQVLLNLLSNAIKYNRDGGRVQVKARAEGDTVRLAVSDTGRGLSEAQMRHLFEPFNRLGADQEAIEGTGIGLAIVKALVDRMGGRVSVQSTPGVGSVFELELEAAPPSSALAGRAVGEAAAADPGSETASAVGAAPASPGAAPTAGEPASAARHPLLYIEDNPVNALIICELVARRADLAIEVASDGASGVERARAMRPELILLDMQLPDMDGFEVMRRLRAQAETAQIPVIALSANAMPDDIRRALAAGMADYWTKPLDFRAFMGNLEQLFGTPPA